VEADFKSFGVVVFEFVHGAVDGDQLARGGTVMSTVMTLMNLPLIQSCSPF
jgi:hypothetical protein